MTRRILIVEDEMLIAMHAGSPKMVRSGTLDCAILEVNLANEKSFPIAVALRERGIPFIFATAYGSKGLDDAYRGVGTIQKPFRPQALGRAIHQALGDG